MKTERKKQQQRRKEETKNKTKKEQNPFMTSLPSDSWERVH